MSRAEGRLLRLAVAISTATGIAFWVMKDLLPRRDAFSVVGHPWQPQMLAGHVLAGPIVVFALGLIARDHVLRRLGCARAGEGRGSGLFLAALAAPMIASGYLLQVLTGEAARRWTVAAHLATGALFALAFAGHLAGAALRRRAASRAPAPRLDRPGVEV